MSDAIEGVTATSGTQDRSSSQSDPYDWFYNPQFYQGINQGTSNLFNQVKQGHSELEYYQDQVDEIWDAPPSGSVKSF